MNDKLLYSVKEAVEALGLSRATFYVQVRRGEIRTVKVGARTLVPAGVLREFVARLEAEQGWNDALSGVRWSRDPSGRTVVVDGYHRLAAAAARRGSG